MAERDVSRRIERMQRDGVDRGWEGWLRDDGTRSFLRPIDIERMAVLFYVLPVGTPRMDGAGERSTPEKPAWSCVAWDRQTRLCREYEQRPDVCRGYPYGNPCRVDAGCDYQA